MGRSLQTVIDLEMTRTEGSKNLLKTFHEYNSISPDVVTRGWVQVVIRLQQISDPAHLSREHRQLQLQYTVGENIIFILLKNICASCERHEEWLYFVLMYFMYFTSGLRKVIPVNCAMWVMQQKCLLSPCILHISTNFVNFGSGILKGSTLLQQRRGEDGGRLEMENQYSSSGSRFYRTTTSCQLSACQTPRHGGKIFADQTKNISIFRPVNIGQHKIKPRLAWIRSSSGIKQESFIII